MGQNWLPGGHLNIKMSYQYRNPHVKDQTVTVLFLTWESTYLGKMVFILQRGSDPDQHFSDKCDLPIETLPPEYSGNILGSPSEN